MFDQVLAITARIKPRTQMLPKEPTEVVGEQAVTEEDKELGKSKVKISTLEQSKAV